MRHEEVTTAFFLGEAEATTAPPAVQYHFRGRRRQRKSWASVFEELVEDGQHRSLVEVDLVWDSGLLDAGWVEPAVDVVHGQDLQRTPRAQKNKNQLCFVSSDPRSRGGGNQSLW
jgi:hypothetical protein